MTSSTESPERGRFAIRAVFTTQGRTSGIRARGVLGLKTDQASLRAKIRALASLFKSTTVLNPSGSVVASLSSRIGVKLAGKFERGGPVLGARFPAIFSSHKGLLRLICDLDRLPNKATAGKCFSLCVAFVNDCSQAPNRIARALFFSPVVSQVHLPRPADILGLVAVSDGHRSSKRKIANVREPSGEIRNV